jgi:hypothetical protein
MEKNYNSNAPVKSELQNPSKPGVSMETKILLAKVGLLICIILLIVARSSH